MDELDINGIPTSWEHNLACIFFSRNRKERDFCSLVGCLCFPMTVLCKLSFPKCLSTHRKMSAPDLKCSHPNS